METDRRRVRNRIHHLERELIAFARHRDQRRARRARHRIPIVSIVGYTNAGKSTLLNALTKSRVSAQDRPFETLDTASRRLRVPPEGKGHVFPEDRGAGVDSYLWRADETQIIITDTVGFIRDLPKDLKGAFRTTLEELRDADLLLHLADAGARDVDGQIKAVEAILSELELNHIPRILVFNKADRLHPNEIETLIRRYGAMAISAWSPETLSPLVDYLNRFLAKSQWSRALSEDTFAEPVSFLKA